MTLKEDIHNIIEENFEDLNKQEKQLLLLMSFRKILNNPYYKKQYKNTSVIELNEGSILALHRYKDAEDIFFDSENDEEYEYEYDDHHFYSDDIQNNKNIKSIYLNNEDHVKISIFYQKINQCDHIDDFKCFIAQEINNDLNYIDNIRSLSYLLRGSSFESFILKFKTNKFRKTIDINNEEYNEYRKKLNPDFLNKLKNESEYLKSHADDLFFITSEIKLKKPYLFENTNINDIQYVFFEINPFVNTENSYIKDQSAQKIEEYKKSDLIIYNDQLKEKLKEWYKINSYSERDLLFHHLYEQQNEISQNISKEFLGFNYISNHTFSPNNCSRSFLLAIKNNEVIGSLVYQDHDYQNYTSEKNSINTQSHLKSAVTANVKKNYRGLGLSALLYDKLSEIMMKEKFIYINTYYTDLGYSRLLKMKSQLNKEKETCFFLDTDLQYDSLSKEAAGRFVGHLMKIKNENFIPDHIVQLKNIYNNNIKKLSILAQQKENGDINFNTLINETEKINDEVKISIEKLVKPVLKKKLKL